MGYQEIKYKPTAELLTDPRSRGNNAVRKDINVETDLSADISEQRNDLQRQHVLQIPGGQITNKLQKKLVQQSATDKAKENLNIEKHSF